MSAPTRSPALRTTAATLAAVLLCAPYGLLAGWMWQTGRRPSLAAFALTVALTWILIAGIARNWRRFLLWQFPLFLISAAFATYTLSYGNTPGYFLAAVLATSSREEYLGFFSIWYGQRLLLATLLLAALYLWAAWHATAAPISAKGPTRLRTSVLAGLAALGLFAALHPDTLIDGAAVDPMVGSILFAAGPLHETRVALSGKNIKKTPYGASRQGSEEVHILVIGESGRRDSWSLYGYSRATTPYLDSIKGQLTLFSHAVSDANMTAYAVPIMLTGMAPERYDLAAVRGNIIDLAKEGGYSTSWLTNQDVGIAALVGVAAQKTVYSNQLTPFFGGPGNLDGSMLPAIKAEMQRGGAPRFIAIHAMGSHWEYYLRYPPDFQRFGSAKGLSFISAFASRPDQKVVDAYDNSVLYSDWFLGQVIESARVLKVPATVTYVADHGEDLYSLDGSSGHGFPTYTPHQFNIPAFVWVNDAYRQSHPDKIAALTANAGKPIRTHDVFYALADLMGISWPGAAPRRSFSSAEFVPDGDDRVLAGGNLVAARIAGP
ncbi:MAG: phosphoethanolamine transferase [Steroidobacteraceae bacterium]|jgi:glucan phosphoethanolaminetransferase (alkaline phosphatase superfamily)